MRKSEPRNGLGLSGVLTTIPPDELSLHISSGQAQPEHSHFLSLSSRSISNGVQQAVENMSLPKLPFALKVICRCAKDLPVEATMLDSSGRSKHYIDLSATLALPTGNFGIIHVGA